jgi:transcriptional regulator with XRE-family HTH domain
MNPHALPLAEFLKTSSQSALARAIGISQSAISRMLAENRSVWIARRADGSLYAYEIRPIPREAAA